MLTLTRKADYALVALAYLAQHHQEAEAVSARRIADQYDLPLSLLMNILKELAKAGIVSSTRGPQGGYRLAADPTRVSVLEIVTALEGPVRLAQCADPERHAAGEVPGATSGVGEARECCALMSDCPISGPIRRLNDRLHGFLRRVTLADLMAAEVDVTVERVGCEPAGAGRLPN